jgi:hypothetical protein
MEGLIKMGQRETLLSDFTGTTGDSTERFYRHLVLHIRRDIA